jgi:hypothetical protein
MLRRNFLLAPCLAYNPRLASLLAWSNGEQVHQNFEFLEVPIA